MASVAHRKFKLTKHITSRVHIKHTHVIECTHASVSIYAYGCMFMSMCLCIHISKQQANYAIMYCIFKVTNQFCMLQGMNINLQHQSNNSALTLMSRLPISNLNHYVYR